jgi:hypothetical protein
MTPVFHDIALQTGGRLLEHFGRLVAERCRELADPASAERIAQEFGLDK